MLVLSVLCSDCRLHDAESPKIEDISSICTCRFLPEAGKETADTGEGGESIKFLNVH